MKVSILGAAMSIVAAQPCLAQVPNQQQPGTSSEGATATPAEPGRDVVIVTAQRREENLEEIPATVNVLDDALLSAAGVQDLRDLTKLTPGLTVGQSSYATQPIIRGVGSRSTASGDESQVAVYVDGVYQADLYALNVDLANVQRVEVLKGPQGTLFGRNATGGAISVITKQPSFTPEGDFAFTYGTFNYRGVSARVSGPLTENLAADLSVEGAEEDGYIDNIATGRKDGGRSRFYGQASLLFTPTEDTEITLRGVYSNKVSNDQITNALDGNARARTNLPGSIIASEPNTSSSGPEVPYAKPFSEQYSIKVAHDFDAFSVQYVGASINSGMKVLFDNDVVVANLANVRAKYTGEQVIHDFLVSSRGDGPFQWIGGANSFKSESGVDILAFATSFNALNGVPGTGSTVLGASSTPIVTFQEAEALAAFLEGTYRFGENLFITAGYRYTDETHDFVGRLGATTNTGSTSFSKGTPHVTVRYNLNPDVNIYASYSEGFKSGLYNGSSNSNVPARPETIDAIEVGIKANVTPDLQVNAAAYTYQYHDLQVQSSPTNTQYILTNAAQSEIKGFEANAIWDATDQLRLVGNVSYVDATYTDFPGAQGLIPNTTTTPPNGNIQQAADASGMRIIRTPEWTGNLGIFWETPLPYGSLSLDGNVYYTSEFYWDVINLFKEEGYALVDLGAEWKSPKGDYSVRLSANNVTDEEPAVAVVVTTNGTSARYLRPRSVNLTLSHSF